MSIMDERAERRAGTDAIETVSVIEVDADGIVRWVSDGITTLTGHLPADLVGQPLITLVPARMRDAHLAAFERFVATGTSSLDGGSLTLPAVAADGSEADVHLVLHVKPTDGRRSVIGVMTPTHAVPTSDTERVVHRTRVRLQQLIAADRPVREVIHAALEPVVTVFGWSIGVLWSFDPWVERLTVLELWEREPGAHPTYVDTTRRTRFRSGQGFSEELWRDRVPWRSRSLPDEPRFIRAEAAGADGLRAGVFVPIVSGGRMIGIVELVDDVVREIDDAALRGLREIAAELGRHLGERLRRETEKIQRERLELALAAGRLGVWTFHPGSGQVTWDPMVEQAHGIPAGSFGGDFESFVEHIDPDDRDEALRVIGEAVEHGRRFDIAYRTTTRGGVVKYIEGSGSPLVDVDGELQLMIGVADDVTDAVRDRELLRRRASTAALAADVGRSLIGVEPLDARLGEVVEAIVGHLDVALARLWVLEEGSSVLELVASAGLYQHLDGEHGRIPVGKWKIGRIADSQQPHVTNDVLHDPNISDPDWAEREGIQAFAGFPLMAQDRCVGVLGVFARRVLDDDVVASLSSLTASLAVALVQDFEATRALELLAETERQREIAEDQVRERQRVASVLQQSLLPPELPVLPGFDSAAAYRPGIEEVGGDFYDLFPLSGDRWGLMIGDVCGRGPEAARYTALARHTLRTTLVLGDGPARALELLDRALTAADTDGRFCTAVCATVSLADATVRIGVAGHPSPLVVREGGVELVERTGPLLGVLSDARFGEVEVSLGSGDALVLYTDGVTEARNESGWFGIQRLTELARELSGSDATSLVDGIVDRVNHFDEMQTSDDLAVLAIRRV